MSVSDNPLKFHLKLGNNSIGGQHLEEAILSATIRGGFDVQEQQMSHCRQEMMSVCAADNGHKQKECCFYEKSNGSDRCMYYVFGEYCDCLPAQRIAQQQLR